MEFPRGQYSVQSSLTFLSMTFLKLIHHQELPLVQPFTQTLLEQLKIYAETSLKTMSENGLKMNSNETQCILFANQISTNGLSRFK